MAAIVRIEARNIFLAALIREDHYGALFADIIRIQIQNCKAIVEPDLAAVGSTSA